MVFFIIFGLFNLVRLVWVKGLTGMEFDWRQRRIFDWTIHYLRDVLSSIVQEFHFCPSNLRTLELYGQALGYTPPIVGGQNCRACLANHSLIPLLDDLIVLLMYLIQSHPLKSSVSLLKGEASAWKLLEQIRKLWFEIVHVKPVYGQPASVMNVVKSKKPTQ